MSSSTRPTYTPDQISQFYQRINLPSKWRLAPGPESQFVATGPEGYEYLYALQRYTLSHIPFENLELHYSRTKHIDIHPQILFKKIITSENGRGGYCMENNNIFATVLRTLGFKFYTTCARVSSAASPNGDVVGGRGFFYGFAHLLNLVTLNDRKRYMVDVGFGAGSCTKPLPLEDGTAHLNMRPSQQVRLRYDVLEGSENLESKFWLWEKRNSEEESWVAMTCFPDSVEFLPQDFEMMNLFCSTSPMTFFTQIVLAVRFILSEDGEEIVGEDLIIGGRYQRRIDGVKMEAKELNSEQERISVLEENLGIRLDEHQQSGILGMVSMLS
ncbi:Arylamine N-acetyltransferase / N-hydroxyarylamine O-acetyltransferase [Pseudocercospora fuligena]|uniref:Arylamine N-acetyltransferase / N-hydroxyarylamine O-acetyltransferase n=1 Tax=Pseudocercospora fuligena TaxID=685502 RepID=A0A8H6VFZ6_9PEZI|nr:Arylamine N-acetyltransferase / N-hydroxyarylamine O-acetyltransferase [Pseudocercospora fuligena]